MAIPHLTDEQIRTWTREQKDRWWLENVYRGDMPQLTLRSAATGFLLGGVLAATALYIAGKTGIGIGVGLTSVILAFAIYRGLSATGIATDFTILENNAAQSAATAAGYMTQPLIGALAAYMLVTQKIIPAWDMIVWMIVIALIGVLLAFPLKRRFINEEQMPFPEGRAAGVVLDALYTGSAASGMFKAKLLGVTAAIAGTYQLLVSDGWMKLLQFKLLRMHEWLGMKEAWTFHERLDTYYYQASTYVPRILGTDIRQLGLRLTLDMAMLGVGGLMGLAVATSCLIGMLVNFVVLAPLMIRAGDIAPRIGPTGALVPLNRAEIVNQWSLWWGVTMMVVGSLVSLLARPQVFLSAFKGLGGKRVDSGTDVLKHIEFPLWISVVGIPIMGILGAWASHHYFGVPWLLAFISLPLIFVLSIICANSMALTSWTPTGALSKITQFTMGAIDRVNPASNLIPAGMTGEIAANASNLLSDIKPGYMLGAKPRQQAIAHVIGVFSGALFCVPLFYLLFLPPDANGLRSTATIVSDQFGMPSALQWKGVAELIAKGVSALPTSAVVSMVVAAVVAIAIEVAKIATKGRFPLSAVALGLGVVLPPEATFAMFVGALMFWWMGRRNREPGTRGHTIWVEGYESICAGLISGSALVGIGNAIVNVLL
ncbi:MAG TPA: OPT/YSL family transporter [Usitatibacter sp.]|nr:OPT/YSL family transporter [Usitatibacter sp.]